MTDARTFDLDYRMTSDHRSRHGQHPVSQLRLRRRQQRHTITDNVTPANNQTLTYDANRPLLTELRQAAITYDSNSNRLTFGAISYTVPAGKRPDEQVERQRLSPTTRRATSPPSACATQTYNKANQLAPRSGSDQHLLLRRLRHPPEDQDRHHAVSGPAYDLDGHLLTETSAAATPVETDYVYLDGMPISAIQPAAATISALHTDNIGTVRAATDSTKTTCLAWQLLHFRLCQPQPRQHHDESALARHVQRSDRVLPQRIYRIITPAITMAGISQPDCSGCSGRRRHDPTRFSMRG